MNRQVLMTSNKKEAKQWSEKSCKQLNWQIYDRKKFSRNLMSQHMSPDSFKT